MDKDMRIELVNFAHGGWSVYIDGEVLLECLSDKDLDELSIGEIKRLMALDL